MIIHHIISYPFKNNEMVAVRPIFILLSKKSRLEQIEDCIGALPRIVLQTSRTERLS